MFLHRSLISMFICFNMFCFSQGIEDGFKISRQTISYQEEINGVEFYRKLEPRSLSIGPDGSFYIGCDFSDPFDLDLDGSDFSYEEHISSGILYKLNSSRELLWGKIYNDDPIAFVHCLQNGDVILVGENISMEWFWVRRVDENGNEISAKRIKRKGQIRVRSCTVNGDDELIVSLEADRKVFIQRYKKSIWMDHGGFAFFQYAEMQDLYLCRMNTNGRILNYKPIFKERNYIAWGDELYPFHDNVYTPVFYEGGHKTNDVWERKEGEILLQLKKNGRLLHKHELTEYPSALITDSNIFISKDTTNEIRINRFDSEISELKSISLPAGYEAMWLEKSRKYNDRYYILGTHNHNLGISMIVLSNDFEIESIWHNESNRCSPADMQIDAQGNIFILGQTHEKIVDSYRYKIELIKFSPKK